MRLVARDGDLLGANDRVARPRREVTHRVEREPLGLEREGAMPMRELARRTVDPVGCGLAQIAGHATEHVLGAEELGHIGRCRSTEHLGGRPRLQHATAVEEDRLIAEHACLREVVRHLERRESPSAMERAHLTADDRAPARVECAERFVEEQQTRSPRERARECDELAFAAREPAHLAREERRHSHALGCLVECCGVGRAVGDVLAHREMRKEECVLVDEPHAARLGCQAAGVDTVELEHTGARREQPSHDLEERRLSRTGRSDHHPEAALVECEAHVSEREAPFLRADALEPDHRSLRDSVRSARRSVSGRSARSASAAATGSASLSP